MNINYIKEMVRRVTYCYDTSGPKELIDSMGIKLGYLPDYTDIELIRGSYGMINGTKVILIHPDLNEYQKREVYAHELGHAVLHPTMNALFLATYTNFRLEKYETEANAFGAELLLDDSVFDKYMGRRSEYIASCEYVSVKFVELKFKHSNL